MDIIQTLCLLGSEFQASLPFAYLSLIPPTEQEVSLFQSKKQNKIESKVRQMGEKNNNHQGLLKKILNFYADLPVKAVQIHRILESEAAEQK